MSRFFSKLFRRAPADINLETDWDVVENVDEMKQAELSSELAGLRKQNSSSARAILLGKVVQILNGVQVAPLTSDLRTRIFKDLLMKLSPDWLVTLEKMAPGIRGNWYPSLYEKNFMGQILDMTDRTAPEKLDPTGLVQAFLGIYMGLIQAVSTQRGVPVTPEETSQLLELVAQTLIEPLIRLWISTADRVKETLPKQGRLPNKWVQEKRAEEERLSTKEVSARYSDGDLDPLRKGVRLLQKDELERRKRLLNDNLQIRKK